MVFRKGVATWLGVWLQRLVRSYFVESLEASPDGVSAIHEDGTTSIEVGCAVSGVARLFVMPDDDIRRLRDDLHREITFLKDQLNSLVTDFKVLVACNPALLEQVRECASGAGAGIHGVHGCQRFVNKYGSQ